jgi:hypothetical protein
MRFYKRLLIYVINKEVENMGSSFKSPADTAKAIAGIAELKEKAPLGNVIILSFLAGAYIAFGGLLAEVVTGGMAAARPCETIFRWSVSSRTDAGYYSWFRTFHW